MCLLCLRGRTVHNLICEPGKEESDEPGDIFTDRRYRHHRGGLRLTHLVVGVDTSLWALIHDVVGASSGASPFLIMTHLARAGCILLWAWRPAEVANPLWKPPS